MARVLRLLQRNTALLFGGSLALSGAWGSLRDVRSSPAPSSPAPLPTFTRADVAKHRTPEDRIWVTFEDGVYDVTDFVRSHPGGSCPAHCGDATER